MSTRSKLVSQLAKMYNRSDSAIYRAIICPEADDLFYCQECKIYLKDGQIVTADYNGNFNPTMGHVKPDLKLVETPILRNIDFYFNSGDKKCFKGVSTSMGPRQGWIVLTKADGKEICINANNVNWTEEV